MGNILYVGQRGAINSAFAPFSKSSGYATAGIHVPCSGTCICQLARLQVGSLYTNKTISLGGALLKHNAISLDGASLIH